MRERERELSSRFWIPGHDEHSWSWKPNGRGCASMEPERQQATRDEMEMCTYINVPMSFSYIFDISSALSCIHPTLAAVERRQEWQTPEATVGDLHSIPVIFSHHRFWLYYTRE